MSAQDVLAKFQTAPLYHPASTELFDDITLQAGDVVKVSSDGTEYNLPIYSQHILWNGTGMISVESTGNEKRDPLPALRRKQYGYGSRVSKAEKELIVHDADIEKNNERILLWATEGEWDEIAQQYQLTGKSEFSVTHDEISSVVTQTGVTAGVTTFDPEKPYAVGDKCIYNGTCYRFTSAHQGPWTGNDVVIVSSQESRIVQHSSDIALVVTTKNGQRVVNAASIILAINDDGTTSAGINADKIYLSGSTTLSGQVEVSDGSFRVKTAMLVNGGANGDVSIGNGRIAGKTFQISNGGSLVFVGAQTGEHYDISASDVAGMITSASVSGNVLTLTPLYGTPITFSKATTLTGAWGSGGTLGTYTVTATQNGATVGTNSVTPGLQLAGGAPPVANFSAQMTDTTQNPPSVKRSVYGYLKLTNNGASSEVNVNTESDGSGVNVATLGVGSVYESGITSGGTTAWLFYTNAAGSNHQGTLAADAYMYIAYKDKDGNYVHRTDDTWKTPSGTSTSPSIGGSWNGSGTYNITSTPSAASGSKLTVTPSIRLNGNGSDNFSAELLNDNSSPSVEKSVTGYLHQSGSNVYVYKTYSGGVYSDPIAQIAVSGGGGSYNDGWAAARAKVSLPPTIGSGVLSSPMTVTVPSDTVDGSTSKSYRIDLGDGLTWKSSSSGQSPSGTRLSGLSSMILQHRNDQGYIEFYAEICDSSNDSNNYSRRRYYIAIG